MTKEGFALPMTAATSPAVISTLHTHLREIPPPFHSPCMASPILWQSQDQTATLIDIPRSIAAAQGTVQHPCNDYLLSAAPLQAPFASNEPKLDAAKAKLQTNSIEQELHARYQRLMSTALREVRAHCNGDWCLPRPLPEQPVKKRRRNDGDEDMATKALSNPASDPDLGAAQREVLVHNEHPDRRAVTIAALDGLEASTYHIPPRSSFYLGDCWNSQEFRAAVREQAADQGMPHQFDFILLDPPWPNRSVRRTHKTAGSTYGVMADLGDTRDLLYGMDIDMLMSADCLVGVWITNKPAVRELVLGEGGLFDSWGVELLEEWIWLKTTVHGEPVTQLDALWRKPYEVLLLGRRQQYAPTKGSELAGTEVKRKVVLGVPDLHSRKPCLKELIEPLMTNRSSYRALEVFARHLVEGWWSWGNECVKFNSADHWKQPERARP